jgi:hypothetical protein
MAKSTHSTMIEILCSIRLIAILILVANCSTSDKAIPKIKCNMCNSAIVLDGYGDEWVQNRSSIINDRTSIAMCKDDKYIYVNLITSDPEFSMQIMNYGLTFWFDVSGTKKKVLGVQFPVVQFVPPPPKDGKPPANEELQKFLNERLKSIALQIPGSKQVKNMEIDEAIKYGIDANIGIEGEILSYELKYPLYSSKTNSMGLNLDNKASGLKICVETPKVDFNKIMQENGDNRKPPQGIDPPQGQQPPQGGKPPEKVAPPPGQEPSGVERLQEVSNQNLRPRPPQVTRISQWIEVTF